MSQPPTTNTHCALASMRSGVKPWIFQMGLHQIQAEVQEFTLLLIDANNNLFYTSIFLYKQLYFKCTNYYIFYTSIFLSKQVNLKYALLSFITINTTTNKLVCSTTIEGIPQRCIEVCHDSRFGDLSWLEGLC